MTASLSRRFSRTAPPTDPPAYVWQNWKSPSNTGQSSPTLKRFSWRMCSCCAAGCAPVPHSVNVGPAGAFWGACRTAAPRTHLVVRRDQTQKLDVLVGVKVRHLLRAQRLGPEHLQHGTTRRRRRQVRALAAARSVYSPNAAARTARTKHEQCAARRRRGRASACAAQPARPDLSACHSEGREAAVQDAMHCARRDAGAAPSAAQPVRPARGLPRGRRRDRRGGTALHGKRHRPHWTQRREQRASIELSTSYFVSRSCVMRMRCGFIGCPCARVRLSRRGAERCKRRRPSSEGRLPRSSSGAQRCRPRGARLAIVVVANVRVVVIRDFARHGARIGGRRSVRPPRAGAHPGAPAPRVASPLAPHARARRPTRNAAPSWHEAARSGTPSVACLVGLTP